MDFMSPETAILVGILAPLVVAVLTPFLAERNNWRDIAGPLGGVVTGGQRSALRRAERCSLAPCGEHRPMRLAY